MAAHEKGAVATAPTSTAAAAPVSFAFAPDPARAKSLKRQRETTPTPAPMSPDMGTVGDLSPSKIARLIGFARQSPASPLTGAAALEDERRRKEEEHHHHQQQQQHHHHHPQEHTAPPPTSPNPSHRVLADLIPAMSRPQDAPPAAPESAMPASDVSLEAAALATVRALDSISNSTNNADSTEPKDNTSPQGAMSAASLSDGTGEVVHSPGQMDVDSHDDSRLYAQQPDAQMEDKTAASLSYPGVLPPEGSMSAPAPPRGMSLPMQNSQNPDLAPRSPGSKKHKCPYCDTEFTRHHNLKSHLLTHSHEKPYVCQSCQMRFRRLHDLKRHSKLHTGEKPHICPSCDRKFARGDALARHSKGAGGCAGRRTSMGSFTGDDFDDRADDMTGVLYANNTDGDMTEDERRRLSLPGIQAQHVPGQPPPPPPPQNHSAHPSTYPPAGPRPAHTGGLYPPNVDRGSSSATTSPSVPNNHTPHTSISSMPVSAGSSSMFSQSGMTESPKPLSPSGAQQTQQQHFRQPEQAASGLSLPSHGMSQTAQQAWLSQYPPADRNLAQGNAATTSARARPRGSSGAKPPGPTSNGSSVDGNNLFATGDQGVWAYVQHLDDKVKHLMAEVEAGNRDRTQLIEKLSAQEQHVADLTTEVAALRQQLSTPQRLEVPAPQQQQQ
ncbi:hypothetical protein B0T22DRAFT_496471 [Podospora appendiculata]|uniref:C2H2-type domain-containing protein n=1 Tax=Podospora appendiculata TaxID=314037 RepID=A0AAE1CH00_9PEZI|nr:hypothetical protein B0T22DRAFT_496471 [Podospora appendiculata]